MDEASGCAPRRPAVGGDLLDALDAALVAVRDDDALVDALCRDAGLVGAVADTEFAVEVLRSALRGIERPDPGGSAVGDHE